MSAMFASARCRIASTSNTLHTGLNKKSSGSLQVLCAWTSRTNEAPRTKQGPSKDANEQTERKPRPARKPSSGSRSDASARPRRVREQTKVSPEAEEEPAEEEPVEKVDLDALLNDPEAVAALRNSLLSQIQGQATETGESSQDDSTTTAQTEQEKPSKEARARASVKDGRLNLSSIDGGKAEDFLAAPKKERIAHTGPAVVCLKKDKAYLFKNGDPIVYKGAVDRVIGRPPPLAGDTVVLADFYEKVLGWGIYNPTSMFSVRIMQFVSEATADSPTYCNIPALIDTRLASCVTRRRALGLPSKITDVYRLVNSEGDRLSGIVVDVLADVVVVQSGSAWTERYKKEICGAITKHTGLTNIVWRAETNVLADEGVTPVSSTEEDNPSSPNEGNTQVVVKEGGLSFLSAPWGQKTGFYADQRDSRAFIRGLADGKEVLDLCCYNGGFTLASVAGGAKFATGVDSSQEAIDAAIENANLNKMQDRTSFVRGDISDFMKEAFASGKSYDIVVLDPPKLAPSMKALNSATSKYKQLNRLALRLVRPGGMLMTCSCSGAMTQTGNFASMVQDAARSAGVHVTLVRKAGAAADHTLNPAYTFGEYLTNATFFVDVGSVGSA